MGYVRLADGERRDIEKLWRLLVRLADRGLPELPRAALCGRFHLLVAVLVAAEYVGHGSVVQSFIERAAALSRLDENQRLTIGALALEPAARSAELAGSSAPDRDTALFAFYALLADDPETACDWLARCDGSDADRAVLGVIERRWLPGDPSRAEHWDRHPIPSESGFDPFSPESWSWCRELRTAGRAVIEPMAGWVARASAHSDPSVGEAALCAWLNPLCAAHEITSADPDWSWLSRRTEGAATEPARDRASERDRREVLQRWERVQHDLSSPTWWSVFGPQRLSGASSIFITGCLFILGPALDGEVLLDLNGFASDFSGLRYGDFLFGFFLLFLLNGFCFYLTAGVATRSGRLIRPLVKPVFLLWSCLPFIGLFAWYGWQELRSAEPSWFALSRPPRRSRSPPARIQRFFSVRYHAGFFWLAGLMPGNIALLFVWSYWIAYPIGERALSLPLVWSTNLYLQITGFVALVFFTVRVKETGRSTAGIRPLQWVGACLFLIPNPFAAVVGAALTMLPVLFRDLAETDIEIALASRGESPHVSAWLMLEHAARADRAEKHGLELFYAWFLRARNLDARQVPRALRCLMQIRWFLFIFEVMLCLRLGYWLSSVLEIERVFTRVTHVLFFAALGLLVLSGAGVLTGLIIAEQKRPSLVRHSRATFAALSVSWSLLLAVTVGGLAAAEQDLGFRHSAVMVWFFCAVIGYMLSVATRNKASRQLLLESLLDLTRVFSTMILAMLVCIFWSEPLVWSGVALVSVAVTLYFLARHLGPLRELLGRHHLAFLTVLPVLGGLLLPMAHHCYEQARGSGSDHSRPARSSR